MYDISCNCLNLKAKTINCDLFEVGTKIGYKCFLIPSLFLTMYSYKFHTSLQCFEVHRRYLTYAMALLPSFVQAQ